MPTDWLPPKKREGILLFVGAIGKWSLVDTFVLFLMMVAFNMRIALQEGEIRADVRAPAGSSHRAKRAQRKECRLRRKRASGGGWRPPQRSERNSFCGRSGSQNGAGRDPSPVKPFTRAPQPRARSGWDFSVFLSSNPPPHVSQVFIVTKFGFYGFLFATMASLSMGSVVLWFHRYTTNYVEVEEGGDKISLSDMKHRYGKLLVKSTDRGRTIVAVVLTATALLMIGGSFIPSFAFDIQGLAGMAVELSPDSSPNNKYSLVTMGLIMPYATLDPNDLAIRWCQVTYVRASEASANIS
jgi:hypothetical protein